jgi:tRNA uridine 5-carboxymethylaminomethyl modification enzyme
MERYKKVLEKVKGTEEIIAFFKETSVSPEELNPLLISLETEPIRQKIKLISVISRPQLGITELEQVLPALSAKLTSYALETIEQSEILMKYQGYINKEQEMVDKMNKLEHISLDSDYDYNQIRSLSNEARQKLALVKPRTLGQASRISGVSPSDISILMVHMGR